MERGVSVSLLLSVFIGVVMLVILVGIVADSGADGFGVEDNSIATYNTPYNVNNDITTLNSIQRNNATWLEFNGTNDWAYVPDSDNFSINNTDELTVSFWVNFDALNFSNTESDGYVNFLGKGDTGQWEWYFRIYNQSHATRPNRMSVYVFNTSGGTGVGSYVQEAISVDEWIHVTAWWSSTQVSIWKNGVQRDTDAYSASIIPGNGIANLTIGSLNGNSFIEAGIDDVRVFNRVLKNWEIKELSNQSVYSSAKLGQRVPILSYRNVQNGFTGQMNYLAGIGVTPITFGQYYNWTQGLFVMPEYPVLLVFDDGLQITYDSAKPQLDSKGFVGNLGIMSDKVGVNSTQLNWTTIQEIVDSGWGIASHSNDSNSLTTLTEAQRSYALNSSKQAIIGNLSITPLTFIYPLDQHNSTIDAECATHYTLCTGDISVDTNPSFTYKESDLTGGLDRVIIDNGTGITSIYKRIVYPEGQVLQLRLNENQGSTLNDASVGDNDGTLVNGTWGNDSINLDLAANEYTLSGRTFTLTDSFIDPIQLRLNYDYHSRYLGQFFIAIIQIVLALALLIFIYAMIRRHIE